jgi:uncharacterized protein
MDGKFIVTHSGRKFYFEWPEEFDYVAEDIGFALGNLCRFAGHGGWYSVAQHCLFVSSLVDPKDKLRALLHDASEAYLVDVPGPLKRLPIMDGYRDLEERVMTAIYTQFGVPVDTTAAHRVKEADLIALRIEARYLGLWDVGEDGVTWGIDSVASMPPYIASLNNGNAGKAFTQEVERWKSEA